MLSSSGVEEKNTLKNLTGRAFKEGTLGLRGIMVGSGDRPEHSRQAAGISPVPGSEYPATLPPHEVDIFLIGLAYL